MLVTWLILPLAATSALATLHDVNDGRKSWATDSFDRGFRRIDGYTNLGGSRMNNWKDENKAARRWDSIGNFGSSSGRAELDDRDERGYIPVVDSRDWDESRALPSSGRVGWGRRGNKARDNLGSGYPDGGFGSRTSQSDWYSGWVSGQWPVGEKDYPKDSRGYYGDRGQWGWSQFSY